MNLFEIGNIVRLKSENQLDMTVVKINTATIECMYFWGLTKLFKTTEIPPLALHLVKK